MILGINSFTHDSSIALINEFEPLFLIEEERLSRIKHHDGFIFGGTPPIEAIDLVKKNYQIEIIAHSSDIDYSAMSNNIPQLKFLNFANSLDPGLKKTKFFNHHLCHAASSFFTSEYESAYIMTLDSRGDGLSLTISIGHNNTINKIFEVPARTSICSIYSYISELLGLGKRNEGSLMALASYGNKNLAANLFYWTGYGININNDQLIQYAKKAKKFTDFCNIAYSIQNEFENLVITIIDNICVDTNIQNLCLSGGGFLNCRLNKKIYESKRWKSIHIPPCPSDSGTALGAALLCLENPSDFKLAHAFWGSNFSKQYILKMLQKFKIRHSEADAMQLANLVSKGKIVAVFSGRMEFGPRALGNRSIIADPRNKNSKDKLNSIKKRKPWRPVAPAILDDYGMDWFENYKFSPFMSQAFALKKNKHKVVPAIVHIDNSSRIQSVTKNDGFFYDLISSFHNLTGIPLLCNTSFNINSPIVQSPEEALAVFFSSAIDCLYIEGLLVTK